MSDKEFGRNIESLFGGVRGRTARCGDGLPSERLHDERKGEQRQQREDRDHGRHYTTAYPRGIYVLGVGRTKGCALADSSSPPGVGHGALCLIVSGIGPSNIHNTFVIMRKALIKVPIFESSSDRPSSVFFNSLSQKWTSLSAECRSSETDIPALLAGNRETRIAAMAKVRRGAVA